MTHGRVNIRNWIVLAAVMLMLAALTEAQVASATQQQDVPSAAIPPLPGHTPTPPRAAARRRGARPRLHG